MTRSILSGLLGMISVVTIGVLPVACQSGGVGDPCTPEDEYSPDFAGFKMTEENIESRSFQCATRICLVNHFQGRVSCPLGQGSLDTPAVGSSLARKSCKGKGDTSCGTGEQCVEASTLALECTSDGGCPGGTKCKGLDAQAGVKGVCDCSGATDEEKTKFPEGYTCDGTTLKKYVCHRPNNCQIPGKSVAENKDKDCCVPGTDTPVTSPVCGQCEKNRVAQQAVYCSCRCGTAEGQPEEPNFNFCTCPTGFECSEIRPDIGISDPQIAGKYCIRATTRYTGQEEQECGKVQGHYESGICSGTPSSTTK